MVYRACGGQARDVMKTMREISREWHHCHRDVSVGLATGRSMSFGKPGMRRTRDMCMRGRRAGVGKVISQQCGGLTRAMHSSRVVECPTEREPSARSPAYKRFVCAHVFFFAVAITVRATWASPPPQHVFLGLRNSRDGSQESSSSWHGVFALGGTGGLTLECISHCV